MKNTFLSIASISLLASALVSCDSTTKTETTKDTTVVNGDTTFTSKSTSETTTTIRSETIPAKIPTFSSEEVNKGLAEYSKLKDEYVAAVKSKNATEIKAINDKYTAWANQATGWASKLKPDEIQKYSDYVLKLSEEWTKAAKEAVTK
ncbi:hypothetical protein CA265_15225 [Sphingobacteriaceae bacterium GW460-11-11-14-LB5]|nr:hypothetical protein CA265_15225 [Sphingobacteriaceae bacterium GW460-11-11-14-LB5]